MSSFTYFPDKCAHYIAMPLAEREALRAAMVEKYGSIKAFVTAHAFVGASSAIAAHNFGVAEFVGCELNKAYFDASKKRFQLATSQMRMTI